jgi:hypothetical protein
VALAAPIAAQAQPLALGFFDPAYSDPVAGPHLLGRTADAGADIVRIEVGWNAPSRPAQPRDPSDPAYDFTRADAAIRAASDRGLAVLASFAGAPVWAEGPGRPGNAPPGSWRPDPAAVADYGAALARRYSGSFPDPLRPGAALPRVSRFQLWNEPNLWLYLSPQWVGGAMAAPAHYRLMLNAFYDAVKSVSPDALVVTAGTAPYGDPGPGGQRIGPAAFWRAVLCQKRRGRRLRAAPCANPAHFDVLAHHPYPAGGTPQTPAQRRDDVAIADMGKLTRILRAAQRSGRALPRGPRKRVWVTEISFDSAPADPNGIPEGRHARWMAETFYLLWRAGVDTVLWFRILDAEPIPNYGDSNQSGLFERSGRVKLAAQAFRFPFVVEPAGKGRLRAWGRSPVAGRVKIERLRAGNWRRVASIAAHRHGTFRLKIGAVAGRDRLRARIGADVSLTWKR